jgi:hypothetical protein
VREASRSKELGQRATAGACSRRFWTSGRVAASKTEPLGQESLSTVGESL